MDGDDSETEKRLNAYIYDYLMRRNLPRTAESFRSEGRVQTELIEHGAPRGFLFEWWFVFWDIFFTRQKPNFSGFAKAYIEMKEQEKQRKSEPWKLQLMQKQYDSRKDLCCSCNHPGQVIRDNSVNLASMQQNFHALNQHTDLRGYLDAVENLPLDRSYLYDQQMIQAGSSSGLNRALSGGQMRGKPENRLLVQPRIPVQIQSPQARMITPAVQNALGSLEGSGLNRALSGRLMSGQPENSSSVFDARRLFVRPRIPVQIQSPEGRMVVPAVRNAPCSLENSGSNRGLSGHQIRGLPETPRSVFYARRPCIHHRTLVQTHFPEEKSMASMVQSSPGSPHEGFGETDPQSA